MPLKIKQKTTLGATPRAIDRFHKYGCFFSDLLTILNVDPLTASIDIFHNMSYANLACRRPIEKSPLAQIQMSPCAVFGVAWGAADDGDYDEPFGDRSDERFARSGGRPDQGFRGSEVDGAWAPPGLTAGEGLSSARPRGAGVQSARQAEQPKLSHQ